MKRKVFFSCVVCLGLIKCMGMDKALPNGYSSPRANVEELECRMEELHKNTVQTEEKFQERYNELNGKYKKIDDKLNLFAFSRYLVLDDLIREISLADKESLLLEKILEGGSSKENVLKELGMELSKKREYFNEKNVLWKLDMERLKKYFNEKNVLEELEKFQKELVGAKRDVEIEWRNIMQEKKGDVKKFLGDVSNRLLGRDLEYCSRNLLIDETMPPFIKKNGKNINVEFDVGEKNLKRVMNYIRFDDYQRLAQYVKKSQIKESKVEELEAKISEHDHMNPFVGLFSKEFQVGNFRAAKQRSLALAEKRKKEKSKFKLSEWEYYTESKTAKYSWAGIAGVYLDKMVNQYKEDKCGKLRKQMNKTEVKEQMIGKKRKKHFN